jgi:hypothetical protein
VETARIPHYWWMDQENAQWNFTQLHKRMKFCHSQVNGWN